MQPSCNMFAARLVWLTACLLLVQPFSALSCTCAAHQHSAEDDHDHSCDCCAHEFELPLVCAIRQPHTAAPLPVHHRSGECPTDCPCQYRHAEQPSHLGSRVIDVRAAKQLHAIPAFAQADTYRAPVIGSEPSAGHPLATSPSSERCALLCRFTI